MNTVRAAAGEQAATKADLAALKADLAAPGGRLEARIEAGLASVVNRMLLARIAIGALIVALVELL